MADTLTAAPITHMAMEAIRQNLQHERTVASLAVPEEKKVAESFEGKGPADPTRGTVIDISV